MVIEANKIPAEIEKLLQFNQKVQSELSGGAFCLSIERYSFSEPWFQIKTNFLNIQYPIELDPINHLPKSVDGLLKRWKCRDWQQGVHATIEFDDTSVSDLFLAIQNIWRDLYGIDLLEQKLSVEIIDLRN